MRLSSYPYVVVRIGCAKCSRRGQYRLARLADRYGAEISMAALIEQLSADCRYRMQAKSPRMYGDCGAHFVDVPEAMRDRSH